MDADSVMKKHNSKSCTLSHSFINVADRPWLIRSLEGQVFFVFFFLQRLLEGESPKDSCLLTSGSEKWFGFLD